MEKPAAVDGYDDALAEVLAEIRRAETEAVRRSNALVVEMYSRVGRVILTRQRDESYGSRLIDRLAVDLTSRFGGQRGWSARNLRYMRAFAMAWPDDEILQARLQNLSWTHHQILLDRLTARYERLWYADQVISNNWSSRVLQAQIHAQLHLRVGTAPTNFAITMPELDNEALNRLATDPYRLDFLLLDPKAREHALELALVDRITEFLTHLGRGFAYLGRQWRLTVGNSDFFLDLAFYNVHLHAYVIFEIKTKDFAPSHAGQLGFYVTAFERQIRRSGDGPTIGVLLVPDKDEVVVEYTLAATSVPMTIASYTYPQLPVDVRAELPDVSELTALLKGR